METATFRETCLISQKKVFMLAGFSDVLTQNCSAKSVTETLFDAFLLFTRRDAVHFR